MGCDVRPWPQAAAIGRSAPVLEGEIPNGRLRYIRRVAAVHNSTGLAELDVADAEAEVGGAAHDTGADRLAPTSTGMGSPEGADVSSSTADRHDEQRRPDSQELALQRTSLAAERTLFAVLRTGLSIAGGGGVIVSLLGDQWPEWVEWVKVPLAAVFLVAGYGLVFQGLDRYRSIARQVRRDGTAMPATRC